MKNIIALLGCFAAVVLLGIAKGFRRASEALLNVDTYLLKVVARILNTVSPRRKP